VAVPGVAVVLAVMVIMIVMVALVLVLMRVVVVVSGRITVVLPDWVLVFVFVLEGAMVVRVGVAGDGHHRIKVPLRRPESCRWSWLYFMARRA
jgi:hypothetical protein